MLCNDETYCVADFAQIPGNEYYVANFVDGVDAKFRTRRASKFPKKFLIWQAICSCGKKSEEFITHGTINAEIYIKECLQKRLLTFIREHQKSVLFWPDLATSHYAKRTLEFFNQNNINVVPKDANPPNCPELRPIERFWALMKAKLKTKGGVCETEQIFRKKWRQVAKTLTEDDVQTLMRGVNSKVRAFWHDPK